MILSRMAMKRTLIAGEWALLMHIASRVPAGLCIVASCTDRVKNGEESDVDFGGALCSKCGLGRACMRNTDCSSSSCNSTCHPPSCLDKIQNQDESDVDCGGNCLKNAMQQ
jgi:hypothetical protein